MLFLSLLIATSLAGNAQRTKSDSLANKTPAINKSILPSKSISKAVPKQPDIIVTALSISRQGSVYYASYTLKNAGTAAVKKGWLSAQGYINSRQHPCGGSVTTVMVPEKDELLNPGESISGKLPISLNGLTIGSTYTYILSAMNAGKVDAGTPYERWVCENHLFQESNIENNLKQATFVLQL